MSSFCKLPGSAAVLMALGWMTFHSAAVFADAPEHAVSGAAVTLSGRTAAPPLPGAAIELRVAGSTVAAAAADEQGAFSLELSASPPDELISVKACGVDEQSHICWLRLADTLDRLQATAADPQNIEIGPLSAASTAAYVALSWTMGEEPVAFSQIEQHRLNFETAYIPGITRVLLGVTHGLMELPAGIDDTATLALDREAFVLLYGLINNDQALATLPWMEGLSGNSMLYLRPALDFPVDAARLVWRASGILAYSLLFHPGGEGEYRTESQGGAMDWRNALFGDMIFTDKMELIGENNRYVEMTGPGGAPLEVSGFYTFIGGQPVLREDRTLEVRLRGLDLSETVPLASQERVIHRTYPDNPELAHLETLTRDTVFVSEAFVHSEIETPEWTPPAEGESWLIPCFWFCESVSVFNADKDKVTFGAGGEAEFERLELAAEWTAGPNGIALSGEALPDISGLHLGTAGDLALLHFEVSQGVETRAMAALAIKFDAAAAWDLGNPPLRLQSLINDTLLPSTLVGAFVWQFNADGVGWQATLDSPDGPEPGDSEALSWEITPAGRLRVERMLGDVLNQVREWELIRSDGDDFFIFETVALNSSLDPEWEPESAVLEGPGRLHRFRRVEL